MILEYTSTNPITNKQWFMLELRSEKTSEETIKRIGKALKDTFQEDSVEVFVPVIQRDLDTFVLLTECYVFVRADDAVKVGKLKKVTGVQGVLSSDESSKVAKFIRVDDDYVQGLIKQCWEAHYRRAQTIRPGSWVRLLDGQTRDYCGLVMAVDGNLAMIRIDQKTKMVNVQTPVHNLLDLSHVPESHRVFYYSDPVKTFLEEHGPDAESAIGSDREFNEEALRTFIGTEEEDPGTTERGTAALKHHTSREQTPTRFVKGLILQGERDVKVLLEKTVAAIRGKVIKSPKTATILWHVIRETVVTTMFGDDKRIKTYSDIVDIHGETFDLTPSDVVKAIPELPLRQPKGEAKAEETLGIEIPASASGTVSSMVRHFLQAGLTNLKILSKHMSVQMNLGTIRAPKHLESYTQAIRAQVLRHYKDTRPGADIKQLAEEFGQGLHITTAYLREHQPELEERITALRDKQFRPVEGKVVQVEVPGIISKKPAPKLVPGVKATHNPSAIQAPKARPTVVPGKHIQLDIKPPAHKAKKPTPEPATGTV